MVSNGHLEKCNCLNEEQDQDNPELSNSEWGHWEHGGII